MTIRRYNSPEFTEAVMKEALWLAFKAAGGPIGMGRLQDRENATKDDVWENARVRGDYPGSRLPSSDISADYVFGRMLKLYIRRSSETEIEIPEHPLDIEYQAWCNRYKTYGDLFDTAETNVSIEFHGGEAA